MNEEVRLMKGNEALAEAAIRCGCDGWYCLARHYQSQQHRRA
mgnify:CR=1 FL=1